MVRAAQNMTEKEFQPSAEILAKKYPHIFYEMWGFRYVGYKYYILLLNSRAILNHMPVQEKWFFWKSLEQFSRQRQNDSGVATERNFLNELSKIPPQYQSDMLRGLGMRVGADMLFDPMCLPDYPLDSRFGEQFSGSLKEAFYEGVGSGFAETLCRFWRTLLLPEDPSSPSYAKMLDIEWERCNDLMHRVSPLHAMLIQKGFISELKKRNLDKGILDYINHKLEERKI
jgi:hypothetical protein